MEDTKEKRFVGLDGLKRFWTKAKTWIAGQITAEVTAKIAELVANAPEDLDTLKEISDWITEHANSAAEMNTQIIKNQDDIKLLQNKTVESCPVGTIMSGLYSSAPTGFLLCNGQEVSVSDYQALYSVIGSLDCCKSSNAGMFKLPDLRGRFLEGANGNLGELIEAGLPNIKGEIKTNETYGSIQGYHPSGNGAYKVTGKGNSSWQGSVAGTFDLEFDASKGETKTDGTLKTANEHHVYGASDTVQPPAVCVNYIIKY